jgi:hypothetical protein
MKNERFIENQDFYSSAFLMAMGHELLAIEKVSAGWNIFKFNRTPEAEKHLGEYFSNNGAVNPSLYVKEIKTLKRMIHTSQPNSNYAKQRKDSHSINRSAQS